VIREEDVPTCPQCNSNDRVVRIRGDVAGDLARWFCDRCQGRLSALPALPATGRASEAGPKRRKLKEED
jgi:transposase-like protein